MGLSANIKGWPTQKTTFTQMLSEFPKRVVSAMYLEANIEMTESKKRVPVKTGVLRASGRVEQPVATPQGVSVELSYGGAAEAYALIVHEDLEMNHPNGGEAKYLESVLQESAPHMAARLAARLWIG